LLPKDGTTLLWPYYAVAGSQLFIYKFTGKPFETTEPSSLQTYYYQKKSGTATQISTIPIPIPPSKP
jgi:hypothetical protein